MNQSSISRPELYYDIDDDPFNFQVDNFHEKIKSEFRFNQVNDTNGPEFIWVIHSPETPTSGISIVISTKVIDTSGIENVTLLVEIDGKENITFQMTNIGNSVYEYQLESQTPGTIVEYSIRAFDASETKNENVFNSRSASFAVVGIINPINMIDYPFIALAQSMIFIVVISSTMFLISVFIQALLTPLLFHRYYPNFEENNYLKDRRIMFYDYFLKIIQKIPYLMIICASIAFILLFIFILTDQMNLLYIEENSSKEAFWFYKLGVFYVNEEGSLLFWGSGIALSTLITSRTYYRTQNESFEEKRKKIDVYWLIMILSVVTTLIFWIALLYDSPFTINESLSNSVGRGLGSIYQNYWVVIHAWCIFVSFILLLRPTLKATISGNLFHPEDSMITELRLGWGFLTVGMITGMVWAYDTPRLPTMWHWDPILIIVFVIWLSVTGLLHINIFVQKKSQKLAIQVLGLAIPILMIVGTIINRTRIFLLRHSHGSADIPVWQLTDFYFVIFVIFGLIGLLLILLLSIGIILSGCKAIVQPVLNFIKSSVVKIVSYIKTPLKSKQGSEVELLDKENSEKGRKIEEKDIKNKKSKSVEKESFFSQLLKKISLYRIGRFILWTWGFGMLWLLLNLLNLNPNAFSGPSLDATEFFYTRMLYWALFWLSFFFIYLWRYQVRTKIISYRMIFWGWVAALIILFPLIQILDEFSIRGPINLSETLIYIILLTFIFSFSIILTQWIYYLKQLFKSLIWVRKSIHIRKQLYKLASHTIHMGMVLIILGGVADSSWIYTQTLEMSRDTSLTIENLDINLEEVQISNNHIKLYLNIVPFMEWLTIGDNVFFQLRISRFISWDVVLEGDILDNDNNKSLVVSSKQQTISSISEAWSFNLLQIKGNLTNNIDGENLLFDLQVDHRPFLPQFWIGAIFMISGGLVIVVNPKRVKKEKIKKVTKRNKEIHTNSEDKENSV